MNRILLSTLLLGLSVEAQPLSMEQEAMLLNYRHSFSGKLQYQRRLNRMAMISQAEAIFKTEELLTETVFSSRLRHQDRRLFYLLKTEKHEVMMDALDGSIMSQGRRE